VEKYLSKPVIILVITTSIFSLIINSLDFYIRSSYGNFPAVLWDITLIGLSMSVFAYASIKYKRIFHIIAGTGYLLCNILFVYSLVQGAWKFWPLALFQLNFGLLFATRFLYNKLIVNKLAFH
jgi:hypothetical protein